ncbi:DUF255 domain-containing protein [Flammeovirga sp. SJP92]|uniref:DUF255 domain-containing protein n=1 Tax=Flammeovirga sp. SJP92 TaxID=1775430 RepID=UPI00078827D5|nr:DUF255 domain-containing protein [Flammeovirga sp. SJP92]KXX71960.1 hypothetical protein AVL50_04020 [Flammeovirga sp. SJP92]
MIKQQLLLLIGFFMIHPLIAQKVDFYEGEWEELLKEAKQKNLQVYVGVFTPHCESCKEMDRHVYGDKEVALFYNEHFISYKVSVHSDLGSFIVSNYNIRSFPAHLYFSSNGKILHQAKGKIPVNVFLEKGEEALSPSTQLYTLRQKVDDGEDLSLNEYLNYTLASYETGVMDHSTNDKLFTLLKPEDLNNKKVKSAVSQILYNSDVNSEAFRFFVQYKPLFADIYSPQKMNKIYRGLAKNTLSSSMKVKDIQSFEEKMEQLKKVLPNTIALRMAFSYEPRFFLSMGNDEKAFLSIQNNFRYIQSKPNPSELNKCNDWAWYYYQHSDKTEQLEEALKWVTFSISKQKSFSYLDTQAHLYYKLGRYQDSENVARMVQKHYQETGRDTKAISQLLSNIKVH